jgi:sec-independent protein translocase protein TatC
VVTPTPDPFTMLIAMAPLVVLYEVSLVLAKIFEPKGPPRFGFLADDDEDEDDDDDPDDDHHAAAYAPDGGGARRPDELD